MLQHGRCVLVGDCALGGRQLLIFDELLLPLAVTACPGPVDIRIISALSHLLLEMFVANGNHGSLWAILTAVDALALLVDLGSVALGADEDDVALVDSGVVGATVGSLLVAPSEAGATAIILLSNRVTAQVLPVVAKIEERVPVRLLLARRRRDVAGVGASGRETADAARVAALLLSPVADEGVVVRVQLELLGELLLSHVESLVVHAGGLIVVAAEICG